MKDWPLPQNSSASPPGAGYSAYQSDDYAAPVSPVRVQRMLRFIRKFWWVPALTLAVALTAAISYIACAPPTFISKASMWETEKLRLPEGAAFTADLQNYLGTQIELLRSDKIRQLAMARLLASTTNAFVLGKDGKPPELRLGVAQAPKSTVLVIEAASSSPAFAQAYLNALMSELLEYKKNIRKLVSGDTLASISDQVMRLERDLKADQDALTAFQRTNNLAILQEEGAVAGGYLTRLKTQLSDLKLESQLLEATALEHDAAGPGGTNSASLLADSLRTQ